MEYSIRPNRRIRPWTNYIILSHSRNLITKFYIDPKVIEGYNGYTWGIWQKYWIEENKRDILPCHYFCEYLDKDYVIYKGLADIQPSWYLEDLVQGGVIKRQYLSSIFIVIGIDFSTNIPDTRLFQHLADKLISPMLREYQLDFTKVLYLDECLADNWETNLKMNRLEYKYVPQKYFDMSQLKTQIDKYKKK